MQADFVHAESLVRLHVEAHVVRSLEIIAAIFGAVIQDCLAVLLAWHSRATIDHDFFFFIRAQVGIDFAGRVKDADFVYLNFAMPAVVDAGVDLHVCAIQPRVDALDVYHGECSLIPLLDG